MPGGRAFLGDLEPTVLEPIGRRLESHTIPPCLVDM